MLRYSKFLLRRVAYVPWLLVAGLVLGGAEEAAAQTTLNLSTYAAVAQEGEFVQFQVFLSPPVAGTQTLEVDFTTESPDRRDQRRDRCRLHDDVGYADFLCG